jgi:hypothetical protein
MENQEGNVSGVLDIMNKSIALLALLLVLALTVSAFGCTAEKETPSPTPAVSPTPELTLTPEPTPTPTPEPVTRVFNITRSMSGISITLVMTTWVDNEVEVQWRIVNTTNQSFKAARLYSIFQPGDYATDQTGKEAEYFIPVPITKDLEPGDPLIYKTKLLFYPQSTQITIRLSDTWVEGNTFTDLSVEFSFAR